MGRSRSRSQSPGVSVAYAANQGGFWRNFAGYIYTAVAVFALMTMVNYYQIPQAISRNVKLQLAKLALYAAPETATSMTALVDPVGSWNDDGSFNDLVFTHRYKCNENFTFGVNLMRRKPFMMYLRDLLTPGEAQHLIEVARPLFVRSTVVGDENYVHEGRTSHSAFLQRSHDKVVKCIEQRVSRFVNKPVPNIEPLQVVWYREGQKYEPHYDWFERDGSGGDNELTRGGQREITIFAYLNTVDMEKHGGATSFPEIDVDVPARLGDAAFWYNTDADQKEDPLTKHGGSPIIGDGEKFGLNIWIRQGSFD
ncbi:hypothetical protein MP228_001048 [Amoeboaphelidium protococcarum]|nr:hypothetical protein MP228_001048 [Amoeboaphelidium protococcarum]